jgi:hypothetical protein
MMLWWAFPLLFYSVPNSWEVFPNVWYWLHVIYYTKDVIIIIRIIIRISWGDNFISVFDLFVLLKFQGVKLFQNLF